MTSKNKTVNKAHDLLKKRLDILVNRRQVLRYELEEKYPEDSCGLKWMNIFDHRSKEMDCEIALLRQYISGMYDLIEIIEGEVNK